MVVVVVGKRRSWVRREPPLAAEVGTSREWCGWMCSCGQPCHPILLPPPPEHHRLCRCAALPCRILDNLPIGMVRMREDNGEQVKTYERGFPVGFQDVSEAVLLAGAVLLRLHGLTAVCACAVWLYTFCRRAVAVAVPVWWCCLRTRPASDALNPHPPAACRRRRMRT